METLTLALGLVGELDFGTGTCWRLVLWHWDLGLVEQC